MRQRKNVKNLLDSEVKAFSNAVQALMNVTDLKANYNHYAQIHVDSCKHGCELFLPWHRAYILDYESALSKISGVDLTLPYWDWIGTPAIPDIFKTAPLSHQRYPGGTPLPTADEIQKALKLSEFFLFGGNRCSETIPTHPGRLEILHGFVHFWVGGDMADMDTMRAAFDPIFWSHHSNVDRLWVKWQQSFGNDGPDDITALLSGLDVQRTVKDVLDSGPNGLGYEYIEDSFDLVIGGTVLEPKSKHAVNIGRLKTGFGRAELRFSGLRAVEGKLTVSAIDVALPKMAIPARVSMFGLHANHHMMKGQESMLGHPTALSMSLDVTDAVLAAKPSGEAEIEIRLIAKRGVATDTCRIGVERIQLVLLPD
jgi:hypothetical protein